MQGSLSDSDWKLLLHRIKEGRCTPFLGAGASFPALPLGGGLAERWSSEHSYPLADRTDLPRVAQYLAVTYDSMFPKEELANSFKKCAPPDFSARDEPHSVLSKLPLPIYMTTNYDDFMIRALKAQGREGVRETCRWKSDIKHLPSEFEKGYVPSAQQPVVFHLHGYLDETKSMVLTEDDYLDFLMRISTDQHILPPRIQEAWRQDVLIGGKPHEEVQVIVLGQHHRLRFVEITVQVKDDRLLGRRHVTLFELGRQVLDVALPAASLAHPLSPLRLEGADHEVVVVRCHVDRERELRQHAMGLIPRAEIRRRAFLK